MCCCFLHKLPASCDYKCELLSKISCLIFVINLLAARLNLPVSLIKFKLKYPAETLISESVFLNHVFCVKTISNFINLMIQSNQTSLNPKSNLDRYQYNVCNQPQNTPHYRLDFTAGEKFTDLFLTCIRHNLTQNISDMIS